MYLYSSFLWSPKRAYIQSFPTLILTCFRLTIDKNFNLKQVNSFITIQYFDPIVNHPPPQKIAKNSNKFSKDWSSLYDLRNKVAHGKQIRKDDYTKAQKLIDMFTKDFDECIKIIDSLEMTAEQAEAVEAVAQQVIQKKAETIKEPEIIAFSKYGRDLSDGTMLATTIHPALEAATLMGYPSSVNSDRIYSIMNSDLSQRYYDAPKLCDYKPKTEPYLCGMTEDGKITNELDKILNLNLTNNMFSNEIVRTGIADEHLSKKAESTDEELNGNANISGVK